MMIEIHDLYFKWLMDLIGDTNAPIERMCMMLDQNVFQRRVGNDINRASDGLSLRRRFLDDYEEAGIDPRVSNDFLNLECSWLEMLVAMADRLDYMYDGGIRLRFIEMIDNLGLRKLVQTTLQQIDSAAYDEIDQNLVDAATNRVDNNLIDRNGYGGLFPLSNLGHPDQREVEIWAQSDAYFSEKLEEV